MSNYINLPQILNDVQFDTVKNNKKITYYNIPVAFDIETSSFLDVQGEKTAILYEWTFGINGYIVYGRTWEQFLTMLDYLIKKLNLCDERRIIIYVHNLSYEFQFFRKLFDWQKVFANDVRKPIYALTDSGLEFRCSYLLSGFSLAKLGDNLVKYKCKKLVGDLDYNLIRHSDTELTQKELQYCENDVRVVLNYIQEQIEEMGDITKIPLTQTGYVRNYCRKQCLYSKGKDNTKYKNYMRIMHGLTLDVETYKQLKRAFAGGFVHASAWKSDKILHNVHSFDETSAYPTVMISEKFPMSSPEKITINSKAEFIKNINLYCCLFDVEITNIRDKVFFEHPLSLSKCSNIKKANVDNGRIINADYLVTTWTEQDYNIMSHFYKWDKIKVGNFRRFKKNYLPHDFVISILNLYKSKTELKGVCGKEIEYMKSKQMLNSCYGMCVTDICKDMNVYDDDDNWKIEKIDIEKALNKYNKNKRRFLYYPWGVWVTAYARKNVLSAVYEFKEDYVYSDTDSIKGINYQKHSKFIDEYNKNIYNKLKRALEYNKIDIKYIAPATKQGVKKLMGVWDDEGNYDIFKTLGAKRYLISKNNKLSLTVSGLNKTVCVPYLLNKYKTINNVFNEFDDNLYIPADFTGKNIHTYIDDEKNGVVVDYQGKYYKYHELSSIHLSKSDYTLSLSLAYADYLRGLEHKDR